MGLFSCRRTPRVATARIVPGEPAHSGGDPVRIAADSVANASAERKAGREPSSNCGHVFVLHSNSIGLAADAILIPSDDCPSGWDEAGKVRQLSSKEIVGFGHHGVPIAFEGQITTRSYKTEAEAIAGTMTVVSAYLKAASDLLKGTTSALKRSKPLIALPMPGVGLMDEKGMIDEMGDIVRPLLAELYAYADASGLDFAVATVDSGAFHVAQLLRESVCPWSQGPFWMLPPPLLQEAMRLRNQAADGRLGLLFGAGVSFPSGLPSWSGLLQDLSDKAGFTAEEFRELEHLGLLDQHP